MILKEVHVHVSLCITVKRLKFVASKVRAFDATNILVVIYVRGYYTGLLINHGVLISWVRPTHEKHEIKMP